MKPFTRSLPAVAIASAALLLSATGGAVAGGLITSAQIQDNTVKSKDIKDGALGLVDLSSSAKGALHGAAGPQGQQGPQGAPGLSGYQVLDKSLNVNADNPLSIDLECPANKRVLGVSAHWTVSNAPLQTIIDSDGTGARAFTSGVDSPDLLTIRITCATLG